MPTNSTRNWINDTESGLTLIEMIVSVAIFATVAFVASSALVSVVGEAQRSSANQEAVNNLNVAMSDMARSLRTGFYYSCRTDDPFIRGSNNNCIYGQPGYEAKSMVFIDADRNGVGYRHNKASSTIEKAIDETCDQSDCNPFNGDSDDTTYPITAPNITVDNLTFRVSGANGSQDSTQSTVLITMEGTAGDPDTATTTFRLQTTATKRLLNP
jgi:prepilin-type N-terminal cleavage/methylation domain-containing protein